MYNDMARDVIDDVACDVTNNVDDAAHFRTGLVGWATFLTHYQIKVH